MPQNTTTELYKNGSLFGSKLKLYKICEKVENSNSVYKDNVRWFHFGDKTQKKPFWYNDATCEGQLSSDTSESCRNDNSCVYLPQIFNTEGFPVKNQSVCVARPDNSLTYLCSPYRDICYVSEDQLQGNTIDDVCTSSNLRKQYCTVSDGNCVSICTKHNEDENGCWNTGVCAYKANNTPGNNCYMKGMVKDELGYYREAKPGRFLPCVDGYCGYTNGNICNGTSVFPFYNNGNNLSDPNNGRHLTDVGNVIGLINNVECTFDDACIGVFDDLFKNQTEKPDPKYMEYISICRMGNVGSNPPSLYNNNIDECEKNGYVYFSYNDDNTRGVCKGNGVCSLNTSYQKWTASGTETGQNECTLRNSSFKQWCIFPNSTARSPGNVLSQECVPPFDYIDESDYCYIPKVYCDWMSVDYCPMGERCSYNTGPSGLFEEDHVNGPDCYDSTAQNWGSFFLGEGLNRSLNAMAHHCTVDGAACPTIWNRDSKTCCLYAKDSSDCASYNVLKPSTWKKGFS